MKWLTLFAVLSLAGCGGGSASSNSDPSSSNPPASNSSPTAQGQWTFTGSDSSDSYFQVVVFANLTQSGSTTFFATPANVAVCKTEAGVPPLQAANPDAEASCSLNSASLDATLGASSVNINLTNAPALNGGIEAVTANGTFTASNNLATAMQGSWSETGSPQPDSGNWTAQPNVPFTGTYNGTVNFNGSIPVNVTLTLTQNASYGITGTATLQNDLCYLGFDFSGSVIGGGFGGLNSNNSIVAGAVQTSPGEITFGYKSLNGCVTAGVGVLTTASAQSQQVHASESQKVLLNSVLNALQLKVKLSDKQKELLRKRFTY
jgi:hypothetical protein